MAKIKGSGGSEGGLLMFFIGLFMILGGGYLLTSNVVVHTGFGGFFGFFGGHRIGLTLLPFLIGIVILFFDSSSLFGWIITIAGGVFILLGILMNLRMFFRPISLFQTILMLVLIFGGFGLILRSFK